MYETLELTRIITKLYELVTDQLTNPEKLDLPVQKAFEEYKTAIGEYDASFRGVEELLETEEQKRALEKLNIQYIFNEELMFRQGYLLGFIQCVPIQNDEHDFSDMIPRTIPRN